MSSCQPSSRFARPQRTPAGFESMVPGLWMYFNAFSFQKMGYACAIGVVLFFLILGLTLVNLKYFRSAEQLQGVR